MKKIFFFLIILNFYLLFGQIKIAHTKSFSSLPFLYLMENYLSIDGEELAFYSCKDSQDIVKKFINNQIDLCLLPLSVAVKTYNNVSQDFICLGLSQKSDFYLVTKNQELSDLDSLQGQSLYLQGQNSISDLIAKYYLPENIFSFDYSYSNAQLPSLIINDKISYAILFQPFLSICQTYDSQNIRAYPLSQFTGEDKKSFPLMLLIVRKSLLEEKTETINSFIKIFSDSCNNIIESPESSAALLERYSFDLDYQEVITAIKSLTFEFESAGSARENIESTLNIYLEKMPEVIGNNLPGDEFYY
ncbi:MAG: hypothetical protein K5866_10430 [Treponema sp.]|nr:hypothetical protein [Treponema sp.]